MASSGEISSNTMAADITNTKERCHFLKLPLELRFMIYDFVFSSYTTGPIDHATTPEEKRYLTAVLYSNRQALQEAGKVMQGFQSDLETSIRLDLARCTILRSMLGMGIFAHIHSSEDIAKSKQVARHMERLCKNATQWIKRAESE